MSTPDKAEKPPIYKRRKPLLPHYNASRDEWAKAWKEARVQQRNGERPNPKHSGIRWAASLIVAYGRHNWIDHLAMPAPQRLEALRVVKEILNERKP
jgi:hypothetical protein